MLIVFEHINWCRTGFVFNKTGLKSLRLHCDEQLKQIYIRITRSQL
jgi:hypothetical protein